MKSLKLIFIFLLVYSTGFSQVQFTIIGKVTTSDGYAPSGNVIALQAEDSTFVKGDFFLDGNFRLAGLHIKNLIIQFTSLEFEDIYVSVQYHNDTIIDMGVIELFKSPIALDEVVVKSRRPVYVQQPNGTMAVLIENTVLAASSSVQEILSKSPDVLVDENGAISVFGKGNAILYLNGKRIDQNQLGFITPSNIKKIEIIRNPSAKYDAEGAAVINIHTIKSFQNGYQANLKQNVTYSKFAGLYTNSDLNLHFNNHRFSSKVYYAFTQGEDRHILHTTRNRDTEEVFLQTDLTTEWQHRYEPFSNFGIGLQYDHGDRSYLSLEYSGFYEQLGGHQLSNNTIEDKTSINFYESDIQRNEKDVNHTVSFNFQQSIDSLGSHFFVGGQYSSFANQVDNPIVENSIESNLSSSRMLKNKTAIDIDIFSAQVDYTKVYPRHKTLEIGAKYSAIENRSDVDFFVANDDLIFQINPALSNQFNYRESVAATYLNFKGRINESLQYTVGLRGEYTDYTLSLSQIQGQKISDQYFNFFPQLSLNKTLSDRHSFHFSYTARITRVPYQRLNPVLYYQDPYTSIQGNPESIPEKIHAFEINASLNKTKAKLGYSYTLDPFGGGAMRGEDEKSYVLIRLNFDKKHTFFTSVSRTFETDWLTSTNTINLRYTNIIDHQYGFHQLDPKPNLYIYSNNRIPVKDWFNVELLCYYMGNNHQGLYQRKSYWNITFSLDKSFMNNSLKCRLIANDIFHSVRAAGDYNVGETAIYFHRHWNTNYWRFSIIYDFGKLKRNGYRNKEIGQEEKNRAM